MNKKITFMVHRNAELYENEDLSNLQTLLEVIGASANIESDANGYSFLNITYDEAVVKRKTTRLAGRHEKVSLNQMTYGDLRRLRKKYTMDEIAAMAGLSKRTLYRRLKEQDLYPDDMFF